MTFTDDDDDAPRPTGSLPAFVAALVVLTAVTAFVFWPKRPRPAGPPVVRVIGTVTLDGQPLPDGDVAFDGLDGNPPVHAVVADGRFALEIVPGEKRVLVLRYQASDEKNYLGEPVQVLALPERYSVNSELRATVTANGPNAVDLQLRSR